MKDVEYYNYTSVDDFGAAITCGRQRIGITSKKVVDDKR